MAGVKLINSLNEDEVAQEGLISKFKEKLKKRNIQKELEKQMAEEEKKRLEALDSERRKEEEAKIIEAHKYRKKDREKIVKLVKPILDKFETQYKCISFDTDEYCDEEFDKGFQDYFVVGGFDAWQYSDQIRRDVKKLDEAYQIEIDCANEINKVLPNGYRCEFDGDWDTANFEIYETKRAAESIILMSMDEFEIPATESTEIDKIGLEYVVATESEIFGIDWRGNRLEIAEEGWFKNMKEKAEARRQRRRDESYAKEIDPNHKQTKEPLKLSDVYVEEIRYNTNRKALQSKYPNCKIPRALRDKETVIVLFIDKESGKHVGDMTIDKRKNGTIWLEDLMIKSNFQGRGFSKEAVKLAVTKYDVAYLETFKEGKVAHATYLKCGFKDVPESHPLYEEVVDVMEYAPNAKKQSKSTEGIESTTENYGVLESILHDEEIAEEGWFKNMKEKSDLSNRETEYKSILKSIEPVFSKYPKCFKQKTDTHFVKLYLQGKNDAFIVGEIITKEEKDADKVVKDIQKIIPSNYKCSSDTDDDDSLVIVIFKIPTRSTEGLGVLESMLQDDEIAEEGIFSSLKEKIKKLKEHREKVLAEYRKKNANKYENLPDPSPEEKAYMEEAIDYTTSLIEKATAKYPDMKKYLDMDECKGKTKYQWAVLIYDFEPVIEEIEYREDSRFTPDKATAELKKMYDNANKVYSEVEKGLKKRFPDVKIMKDGDMSFMMLTIDCPKKENKATEGVELKMEKYGVLESILHDEEIAEEGLISLIKDKLKKRKEKKEEMKKIEKEILGNQGKEYCKEIEPAVKFAEKELNKIIKNPALKPYKDYFLGKPQVTFFNTPTDSGIVYLSQHSAGAWIRIIDLEYAEGHLDYDSEEDMKNANDIYTIISPQMDQLKRDLKEKFNITNVKLYKHPFEEYELGIILEKKLDATKEEVQAEYEKRKSQVVTESYENVSDAAIEKVLEAIYGDTAEEGFISNMKAKVKNFQVTNKNYKEAKINAEEIGKLVIDQSEEIANSSKFKEKLKGYPIDTGYGTFSVSEKAKDGKTTYYIALVDYTDMESDERDNLDNSLISKYVSECQKQCSKLYSKEGVEISSYSEDECPIPSLKGTEGLKVTVSFSTTVEAEPALED